MNVYFSTPNPVVSVMTRFLTFAQRELDQITSSFESYGRAAAYALPEEDPEMDS